MRDRNRLDFNAAMIATAFGLGACMAGWWILSLLAKPSDLSARLARVERQTDQAETLMTRAVHIGAYPANAVCGQAPGPAAINLKQGLQSTSTGAGVTVSRLEVVPGVGDEAMGGLTPVAFDLEATGHYDQVIFLLRDLSKVRPQIFVDQTDLRSRTSAVEVKLTGRIYCSTIARL